MTKEEQQTNREKHINRIKSSVANLTGILNDFLSLSKLEEGRVEVHLSELNLDLLCQRGDRRHQRTTKKRSDQ